MIAGNQRDALDKLPVELAIRLVLDDVTYSNALPNWFDAIAIDYSGREAAIRQKLRSYLNGANPRPSFTIAVPRKSGKDKTWTIPSINDQIALQACISSFADRLDSEALDRRVYSYRYNRQPDRLALLEDQVAAWTAFQDETKRRCATADCLLQIDLQGAFQSIDRQRFYDFLSTFAAAPVLDVLKCLLDSFAVGSGLPLLNNSIFFLGNAYLSQVDKIIQNHTSQFIRYVDDYRIFGDSEESLETSLRKIAIDLQGAGFTINSQKLRIGNGLEYLDAISKIQYGLRDEGTYVSPAIVRDLMRGPDIASTISTSVNDPDTYLNEGFGRFQLAVVRKYRFNQLIGTVIKPGLPTSSLTDALCNDSKLVGRILDLLKSYSADPTQTWRAVWLLYVAKDFDLAALGAVDKAAATRFQETLQDIASSPARSPVVRLWADAAAGTLVAGDDIAALHDLGYLESGQRHCKGCAP
jgi:hypothetical protein